MRVVVAEDLFLLRDGLARLLSAHDFEIAAAVDSAPGLLCALLEHRPDIAVVDVRLPPAYADDGLKAALAGYAKASAKRHWSHRRVRRPNAAVILPATLCLARLTS